MRQGMERVGIDVTYYSDGDDESNQGEMYKK